MIMIKTCGACGSKGEADTTECVTYKYKGLECTVPDVTGYHCKKCGEVAMNDIEGGRYLTQTNIFRHVVDLIRGSSMVLEMAKIVDSSLPTSVMVDIETLATTNDAFIVSIGAVVFNKEIVLHRHYTICHKGQQDREVSMETVKWWMKQSDAAREVFTAKNEVHSLEASLIALSAFIKKSGGSVWANGVLFDIGILENAYDGCALVKPWHYGNIRCLRSIRLIYPEFDVLMKERRGEKTAHNALDDAEDQASVLIQLAKIKGFNL